MELDAALDKVLCFGLFVRKGQLSGLKFVLHIFRGISGILQLVSLLIVIY